MSFTAKGDQLLTYKSIMKTTYQINIREVESAKADESKLFQTVATTESMTIAKAIAELAIGKALSDKADPTKTYEVEIVTVVDGLAESADYMGDIEPQKHFPNGFESWTETHYEVVTEIMYGLDNDENGLAAKIMAEQGRGGLYELAVEITDEFERDNEGREWDGEWFECLYAYIKKKLA